MHRSYLFDSGAAHSSDDADVPLGVSARSSQISPGRNSAKGTPLISALTSSEPNPGK